MHGPTTLVPLRPDHSQGEANTRIRKYDNETPLHTGQSGQHKQINKQVLKRMQRKGNPSTLLVGMQTGAATVENSMEFPQKTKNATAF